MSLFPGKRKSPLIGADITVDTQVKRDTLNSGLGCAGVCAILIVMGLLLVAIFCLFIYIS